MSTLNQFYGNIKSIQHSPIFRTQSTVVQRIDWTITEVNTAKSVIIFNGAGPAGRSTTCSVLYGFESTTQVSLSTSDAFGVNEPLSMSVIEYN